MGMFSWKCRRCGCDLCEGELVRLAGTVQTYNGYGGSVGADNVACWHEICYQRSTTAEQLDQTPSESASNQGFGPAKLEFLPGFDPSKTVDNFHVLVHRLYDHAFLTESGLESQSEWDELRCEKEDGDQEFFQKLLATRSDEEQMLMIDEQQRMIVDEIGESPDSRSLRFENLNKALEAVRGYLPQEYTIHVYASQGSLSGAVYEFDQWPKGEKESYRFPISN